MTDPTLPPSDAPEPAPLPVPPPGMPTTGAMPPPGPPTAANAYAAPQNGIGVAALVMGILQFVCLGPIGSILAIVFGVIGRKKAKQGLATNGGVATAGFWLGIVGLVVSVLGAIALAIIAIFGVNAASNALDVTNNQRTGLADGTYAMDPTSWLSINNRCSYGGTPASVDTGQSVSGSVTVVGEGAVQCGVDDPSLVVFVVSGGVAEIVEVR